MRRLGVKECENYHQDAISIISELAEEYPSIIKFKSYLQEISDLSTK